MRGFVVFQEDEGLRDGGAFLLGEGRLPNSPHRPLPKDQPQPIDHTRPDNHCAPSSPKRFQPPYRLGHLLQRTDRPRRGGGGRGGRGGRRERDGVDVLDRAGRCWKPPFVREVRVGQQNSFDVIR